MANTWPYTYLWCRSTGKSRGVSVADTQHELQIGSKDSIVNWNQYCRDIAVSHFIKNPIQIGGPKENSTGPVDFWRLWSCNTKEGFLLPAPCQNATTLMPLIIQWVRLGTKIWSDMWGAYIGLVLLPKVPSTMLLTTNITLSILILGWQQIMSRQCGSGLKQNLNQCSTQQIMTWFQITWQSSCGTRNSRNILISTFGCKLPNSTLYELHGKKQLF